MGHRLAIVLGLVWTLGISAAAAGNQPVPDYGLQWVTIGDPGNRGVRPDEVPQWADLADRNMGAVAHEYRLTKTELTTRQWFEFVVAYAPFAPDPVATAFLGGNIIRVGGSYVIRQNADAPTVMSWEYAARYANWLHNDKALTAAAFESGAYDTSTFTRNPDGTNNHQLARSPGARFWIPSLDEWTKAAYWDPAKDNGEGGYWPYPGASSTPLISGSPESGGQTNAGTEGDRPFNSGSYPNVNAPWGLLDVSGGLEEWTETTLNPVANAFRVLKGAVYNDAVPDVTDRIDSLGAGLLRGRAGLRLASIVPAPHGAVVFGVFVGGFTFRRTRPCSGSFQPCPCSRCRASPTPR